MRRRAGEVTSAEGKQQVIAELYEKFFRIGFKKQAGRRWGSYTPVEVGLHCAGGLISVSRKHFGTPTRACIFWTASPDGHIFHYPGCCNPTLITAAGPPEYCKSCTPTRSALLAYYTPR